MTFNHKGRSMRFRATASVSWEINAKNSTEAQELANKHLADLPTNDDVKDFRIVIRLDKLKDKVEKIRLGEFKIDEVIPHLSKENVKREYECNGIKYQVRMNSQRYFLFRECMCCVACGLIGTRLFLECHPADQSPHFNLYGEEDGNLVLLTKDHIHAKAFGGEDRHSNYQTMCLTCNNLKGHSNLTLDGVREMRMIFNENKNKVTKKALHLILEETRAKLERPRFFRKDFMENNRVRISSDALFAICDINLYKNEHEIQGKAVYDMIPEGHKHVGCIKKGNYLEPMLITKDKIMCTIHGGDVVIIPSHLLKSNS